MKDRLLNLLELEQITPSRFADLIGVQRSSVSHVISGRNKPSFDFLQKTLKAFPGLKADWLMLGEGSMYEQMGRDSTGDLFDQPELQLEELNPEPGDGEQADTPPDTGKEEFKPDESKRFTGLSRKVVQVMIFYDDDTFISFKPAH